MTLVGNTLIVRGEVASSGDLIVEGRVEGPIWADGHAISIGPKASIQGYVVGRDITVHGGVTGDLLASRIVRIGASAKVLGRVISPNLMLAEGATFNGTVEPQNLETAMRVARHRHGPESAKSDAPLPPSRP
jgi:cytoskeletal protein CcmA (bactofilin family)